MIRDVQTDAGTPSVPLIGPGNDGDYLRGLQVHAVEQNISRGLIAFSVAAAVSTLFFYDSYSAQSITWLVLALIMTAVRIRIARRAAGRPPRPLSEKQLRPYAVWCVISASVMMSFPSWIIMEEDGLAFAFMLSLCLGTFWSASFVHAPVLRSSASFMTTQLVVTGIAMVLRGPTLDNIILLCLFVIGVGSAYALIKQHSKTFSQSVLQQIALEKQNEVIGLLLRDHEEQSSDWLWQTDELIAIMSPSPQFAAAFGRSQGEMVSLPLEALFRNAEGAVASTGVATLIDHINAGKSFRDHVVSLVVDGVPRWFSVSGRAVTNELGAIVGHRGVMSDVTSAKQAERQIRHLALHDGLTQLPNRTQFSGALEEACRSGKPFALLSIDLDGFKPINDTYGHPIGDAFLMQISKQISSAGGSKGLVARIGGDEFMVLSFDVDHERLEENCRWILGAVATPVEIKGFELSVGASIGIALAPNHGATATELLKNVDAALYRAKRDGRGTFRFFEPAMDLQLQARNRLAHDLRLATHRGELRLLYQPFVDAASGAVTGCEALVRWHHPSLGVISPVEFIPLAEATGLIVSVGDWILQEACRTAASWPANRRVAVNLSAVQFRDRDLPDRILATLLASGLAPERLEVEVTESLLIDDVAAAIDILRRIRALGVRVALDDFGTGYSSLGYLRQFPFNKIKIDRSFVMEIANRNDCKVIVQAIQDIASGLGMNVTAEGVETEEQATILRRTGCGELQGYLFSKPVADHDLRQWDGWQDAA
ncbi:putative bifunctional diguanylate cyclase/phosphodiesterase [Neorhizobium sp. NPDC001467]|uniref:putative bifunctional diguanylate cyclase/phosphodiesterase n=1 Tax=Neorhizobium sp. NPDC001467 TaxID=3390595 RepID=UPI003CFCCC5A